MKPKLYPKDKNYVPKRKNKPRKLAPKSYNFTEDEVIQAAKQSYGVYSYVAKFLGCGQHTAKRYLEKYPTALKVFNNQEEFAIDTCKTTIMKAIENGDVKAAQWFIAKLHPEKFSENITITGNSVVEVKYIFPSDTTEEENNEFKKLIKDAQSTQKATEAEDIDYEEIND